MNIAQVTYTGFGGLGSVVFSLIAADEDPDRRWQIAFIGDQPLDLAYPPSCQKYNVSFAVFRSTAGKPYRAWVALSQWLTKVKPDAVICHSINSVLACRWYAWWHRAKLLVVEHTPNQVKTRSEWAASRMSMLLADRVVVLTEEYKAELKSAHRWLFRPNKIRLIPNGIDTNTFYPAKSRSINHASVIHLGMAARFSTSKRQAMLISVLEQLATLRPDLIFQLRFAGDGSEFERVQALAADSPLNLRIKFDGLLTERQMPVWFRELDIYVHATDGETLSTSLLQAMATGLPIVASDIPGVSNLLKQNAYGICVDNHASAFANGISGLVDQAEERSALGQRARTQAIKHYSHMVMLQRYLNLLQPCNR